MMANFCCFSPISYYNRKKMYAPMKNVFRIFLCSAICQDHSPYICGISKFNLWLLHRCSIGLLDWIRLGSHRIAPTKAENASTFWPMQFGHTAAAAHMFCRPNWNANTANYTTRHPTMAPVMFIQVWLPLLHNLLGFCCRAEFGVNLP